MNEILHLRNPEMTRLGSCLPTCRPPCVNRIPRIVLLGPLGRSPIRAAASTRPAKEASVVDVNKGPPNGVRDIRIRWGFHQSLLRWSRITIHGHLLGCGSKMGIYFGTLMELRTKTCGPIPGALILTHTHLETEDAWCPFGFRNLSTKLCSVETPSKSGSQHWANRFNQNLKGSLARRPESWLNINQN